MKITITRHGETLEGLRGESLGGRKHGHLAPSGIKQARALARYLKGERFDVIYSSYLKRAKDTALEIAKYHKNTPIKFLKALRERESEEAPEDVCARILLFLKGLSDHNHTNILIVSHTGTSRALTLMIEERNPNEWRSVEQLHNTAVSIFTVEPRKKGKCVVWNKVLGA